MGVFAPSTHARRPVPLPSRECASAADLRSSAALPLSRPSEAGRRAWCRASTSPIPQPKTPVAPLLRFSARRASTAADTLAAARPTSLNSWWCKRPHMCGRRARGCMGTSSRYKRSCGNIRGTCWRPLGLSAVVLRRRVRACYSTQLAVQGSVASRLARAPLPVWLR